jgi:hypothetical protein
MPFDTKSDDEIRDLLIEAEKADSNTSRADYELAVNYFEGRQFRDVEQQLQQRYKNAQSSSAKGEIISPITIPITQRYVSEAASLYNRPVKRTLVNKDGVENEEATKAMNDHLDEVGYNQALHQIDQITVLTQTSGRWDQIRRNQVRPRAVTPNVIWPVPNPDIPYPDKTDADDYFGFVVQLGQKTNERGCKDFILITHREHIYYKGSSWARPDDQSKFVRYNNPFTWPQFAEDFKDGLPTGTGSVQDLPLQMLTFWHTRKPLDEILIQTDADIAILNREINITWSVIMDIIRTQSHGQMVFKLDNKGDIPPRIPFGSRFGIALNTEEDVTFETVSHNYSDIVAALQSVVGLYAIAKRLSPNDFAIIEASAPASGFAKMIDSLPKLEARSERITEQKRKEEQESWPRLGAQLEALGIIKGGARDLKLRVEFSELTFPRTVDEDTKEAEFEFKHGLDSPVEKLARESDISVEEAQDIIDKNKAATPTPQQENGNVGRFGQSIARRGGPNGDNPGARQGGDRGDQGGGKGNQDR